jgi:enterochelin esterase family protein
MSGHVQIHAFESRLLAGNALGDAPRRQVPVYLPPSYETSDLRYPVLFALAGFTGTGLSYLNHDWYQPNLPAMLDALIDRGAMPPAVVVMVDGMTALGGNQYVDSPAVGPWARHVTEELVPWAEATFRTLPGRDHRGVFGKSSGGYGAMMMALEHADVFAGAVSHSGDCYFDYCYGPEFPKAADGLRSVGGLSAFLSQLKARAWPKFPGRLFPALNITAMTHFYAPNADAECGVDLPFDPETGERREDVLARWALRDPCNLVEAHAEALGSLSLLWIECGTRDEYNLHHGARILSARLRAAGVEHVHEEFDDDHRSLNYRYATSLPRLVSALV